MKFYFRHPNGWECSFERQPLEKDKFYALIGLAAGAMALTLLIVIAMR